MSEQQTIIIEAIQQRHGGSTHTIGDAQYSFQDDGTGKHIAAVSNPEHVARFLSIPEGFRMHMAVAAAPASPIGLSQIDPATKDDATPAATVVTAMHQPISAADAPGLAAHAPQSDAATASAQVALESMTIEQLRAVFKAELKRDPSPRAKPETLIAQIEAIRDEKAGA